MVSLDQVGVAFGGEDLFRGVSLQVNAHDRIGVVGRNGAGKSTLFRVLAGQMPASYGQVVHPSSLRIGYLAQDMARVDKRSVLEEALQAFGELNALEASLHAVNEQLATCPAHDEATHERLAHQLAELTERYHLLGGGKQMAQAERTLTGLGFERSQFDMPTAQLSGGWRMRVELAKILLQSPDLLLLDEPTNHLDIESIQWLEDYLKGFSGALMLISHDRRFLDTVTTATMELTLGQSYTFPVPYTKFVALREEQREQQAAAYKNQQRLIEKTEAFIERFRYKPSKSNQVQSRIHQLERLERIELEDVDKTAISIHFPSAQRSGDPVVVAEGVSKAFGSKTIFSDANITVRRGDRIAFVGRNGEGKTTMARCIVGDIPITAGELRIGHNVDVGYFAQDQESVLDGNHTVFETIDRVAVGAIRTRMRDLLAAFLFRGDDIDKPVRVLSGGERNRLAMVKLMLAPHNLLVLDEPTNHLDIPSKDLLKQALMKFEGTLILVSHDRDFLDGLANKVYEFSHGQVKEHLGSVDSFLASRSLADLNQLDATGTPANTTPAPQSGSRGREDWKQRKQRENDIQRRKRAIAQLEDEITACETAIQQLESELANLAPEANLDTTLQQYESHKRQHATLLKRWEEQCYELDIVEQGATDLT